jgi:hypothetical protein
MVNAVPFSDRGRILLVSALALATFVLGGTGGYVVRAISASTTSVPGSAVNHASSPCPSGSHAVVWYTEHSSGCVRDSQGGRAQDA